MSRHNGLFREWIKRYTIEYSAALALCLAAAGVCIPLAREASSQITRLCLMAIPTLAVLMIGIVILRQYCRVDEFMRRILLECFAVAGAFVFVSTLVYGILEIAGFSKISMWWAFGIAALVWNLWMLRLVRR
jgi:hypothetical protein